MATPAVQISTTVEFLPVNTSARAGTILLPSTNTFAGRIITIKDTEGTFGTNPLTISTIGGEIFEDGTTSKVLRDPFGYLTLASDGANRWYLIDGTSLNAYTITNITNPLTLNAQSVSTPTTTLCTINLQDTRFGNVSTPIYARSTLLYLGSNIIGGTRAGPTQFISIATPTFSPQQIAGLAIWLDATQVNGTAFPNPVSPSTVGSWCNLTGTGNFTQATLSRQPVFLQNGLGLGRPSVYFSSFGSAAGIQFLASPSNLQITRDASFFFVANYLSTSFMNQSATLIDDRKDPGGITLRTFRTDLMQIRDPVSSVAFAYFPNEANFPQIRSYRDTLNTSLSFLNGVPATTITSNYNQQPQDNFGILLGSHFNATLDDGLARSTFSVFHLSEFLVYNRCLNQSESWQIESYLGNKWGISVTNTFNPSTINGLQLWLDASRLPVAVGGTLTQWNDLSPNQFTGNAVNSPTLTLNTQNNLPGVSFNGTSQYINFGNVINLGTSPIYVFTVLRITPGSVLNGIVGKSASISGAGRWALIRESGNRAFLIDTVGSGPDNRASFTDNSTTDTTVLTGFWDRSNIVVSSNSISRANTVLVNTTNYTTTNSLFIGVYPDNAGTGPNTLTYMNGLIHEVLVYNSFLSLRQRQLIESYLGQKWNIPIQAPFSPLNVPGLSLWLDASQLVGLTNGAALSQWNDISPNLRPGTAINGPTYTTNSQNGLPGITFNGSSQYINFGNVMNMSTQPIYMFVVCKINSGTNVGIIGKSAAAAAAGRYTLLRDGGSMKFVLDFAGAGDTIAQYADSSTATRILTAYYDRNTLFNLENGYPTTFNSTANNTNMTNAFNFFVGAYQDNTGTGPFAGGYYLNGVIYEVLVYQSSMTYIQRQQIQNYLSAKWNVNLSNFVPTQISGLLVWLDGADNTTLSPNTAGATVNSWTNKGSASLSLSRTSGTVTRAIDNYSYLNFASGGIMTSSASVGFTSNATSLFLLMQPQASSGFSMALALSSGNGGNGDYSVRMDGASSTLYNPGNANDWGFNGTTSSYLLNGATIRNSNYSLSSNFNIVYSPVNQTVTSVFTLSSAFNSRFFVGNIGEVLLYSAQPTTAQRQTIEGYLAWKWGITLPSPFSPLNIAGLQLWLDAADASTVTGTTNVTQWNDKSGNGRNATSVASSNIVYSNNGMIFTGTQSFSTALSASMPFQQTFIVMSHASSATIDVLGFNRYSGSPGVQVVMTANVQRVRLWGGADVVVGATITQGTRFIYGYTLNQGATAFIYNTGTQSGSQAGSPAFSGVGNLFIGSYYSEGAGPFEAFVGTINEIIIYNVVLSDYNRQTVEGYLAWKWGVQNNLPATHPFRNNAPQHPFRNTPP